MAILKMEKWLYTAVVVYVFCQMCTSVQQLCLGLVYQLNC